MLAHNDIIVPETYHDLENLPESSTHRNEGEIAMSVMLLDLARALSPQPQRSVSVVFPARQLARDPCHQ
jgi:hypothetical protein